MGLATFKGGVHPYDGKDLSKDQPMKIMLPKGDLVFPLSQHIGAPALPIVKKGEKVLEGQKIAEASGFISANVIASVSGTVKVIEPRLTPSGNMVDSIVITNDHEYDTIDGYGQKRDYKALSKEEIREIVKEAGIVGLGGAGFPTHVKLTPKDDAKIDYVILNGAECEPYLTSDYRVMIDEPEKVIGGLKVILSLFENAKGIIGVEDNKPEAIKTLDGLAGGEAGIEVKPLKTKYPQGGERTLIYACTGRKINSAMLPADVGCIVVNVDTAAAIYMAVCETTPLVWRGITITGDAVTAPANYKVKIGSSYQEIIDELGGFKEQPEKVVCGGPMMGNALYSLDVPVVKASSALLCMTKDQVAAYEPSSCIRCGRCAKVCPGNIIPQKLVKYAENSLWEEYEALGGMECCECGCCTYVCPAKIRLTQNFKQARRTILENRKKK